MLGLEWWGVALESGEMGKSRRERGGGSGEKMWESLK